MVEHHQEKLAEYLTPGEIKFKERVTQALQLARRMELVVDPDVTPERLEDLTRPRNNKEGEIGWSWSFAATVEGRPARGTVDLEVKSLRDALSNHTGNVVLSIAIVVEMIDDSSSSTGGEYWAQRIDRDTEAEDRFQEAGEKLIGAWNEARELASNLPEISRTKKAKLEALMQKHGFEKTASGWTRKDPSWRPIDERSWHKIDSAFWEWANRSPEPDAPFLYGGDPETGKPRNWSRRELAMAIRERRPMGVHQVRVVINLVEARPEFFPDGLDSYLERIHPSGE